MLLNNKSGIKDQLAIPKEQRRRMGVAMESDQDGRMNGPGNRRKKGFAGMGNRREKLRVGRFG